MKKILKIFAVMMIVVMPLALAAEDKPLNPGTSAHDLKPKAHQILDQVKQNMDLFEDYQVQIEEHSNVYGPKEKRTASGITKMTVKKDKRYVEQETDREGVQQKIIQVFDGRRSWVYDQRTKLARKVELNNISKELRDKFKAMMMKQNINLPDADYKLSEQAIEGKNYYVLDLKKTFSSGNQVFDKIKITIEKIKDGRWKIEDGTEKKDEKEILLLCKQEVTVRLIVNVPGAKQPFEIKTETLQEFKDWKFNTGIKDYEFTIALPADAQIIDETENTRMMLEKMVE